jgi:hypothetical protein
MYGELLLQLLLQLLQLNINLHQRIFSTRPAHSGTMHGEKKNTPTGIVCAVPATYKRVLALVSGASHKAFNVACGVCSPDKTRLQTWP